MVDGSRLDLDSYVDIVRDVLKMKKNLCLCRKFNSLNKDTLRQKSTPIYIDVWPVNNFFFLNDFFVYFEFKLVDFNAFNLY